MTPSQVPVQPQVHFGSQTNDNAIHLLFQNEEIKQKYFQIKRKIKAVYNLNSTTKFLIRCISANIIPKSFRINVKTMKQISPQFEKSWKNSTNKSSKFLMNLSINENKRRLLILTEDLNVSKQQLLEGLSLENSDKINGLFNNISQKLIASAEKLKHKKFRFLQASAVNDRQPNQNIPKNTKNRPGKRCRERKRQKILNQKKQQINVVFNLSTIEVDENMHSLLNRGLNFCVKGNCPTESEILTDLHKFERRVLWTEFFFGKDNTNYIPPIFRKEKANLPPGPAPKPLQAFLNTVSTNIRSKSSWNKHLIDPTRKNISKDEERALNQLISYQKQQRIVIKPADKGAGICIIDYDDYVIDCRTHLASKQNQANGPPLPFYRPANDQDLVIAKHTILQTLKLGLSNEYLSKVEYDAMNPYNYGIGKFYRIFKMHKEYQPGSLPPGRPIISGIGSITEKLSYFVDYHSKPLVKNIPTYLQDTSDFLRSIEAMNTERILPNTAIICTIDVSALYTNIRIEDAILAMRESLNQRLDQKVPTDFILQLLECVLMFNIFEFGNEKFIQLIGTAIGTICAPTLANFVMHKIDQEFKDLANRIQDSDNPIMLLKRFIDDYIMIWEFGWEKLEEFLTAINTIHPTLKFTYNYTCPFPCEVPDDVIHDCFCHFSRSIPFLDTLVEIKDGKLITDLYRKPTDRAMSLLPSSNHPAHITKNIPYSMSFRILRICSKKGSFERRILEMKELLSSRKYLPEVIDNAIERIRRVTRSEALKKVIGKKNSDRIPLTITYHPALPSVSSILKNAWNVLVRDRQMKLIYPKPPMVAFKQPHTALKNLLVKTKLQVREKRRIPGLKKCGKDRCTTCPLIEIGSRVTSSVDKKIQVFLKDPITCESTNVIYCIFCSKLGCNKIQYIGETERMLKERIREHIGYVNNIMITKPTGHHFNLPDHNINHMRVQVLEQCKDNSRIFRKVKESRYINTFQTLHRGLNKKMGVI